MRPRKSWEESIFQVVFGVLVLGIIAMVVGWFVVVYAASPVACVLVIGGLVLAATAAFANRYWGWWREEED